MSYDSVRIAAARGKLVTALTTCDQLMVKGSPSLEAKLLGDVADALQALGLQVHVRSPRVLEAALQAGPGSIVASIGLALGRRGG